MGNFHSRVGHCCTAIRPIVVGIYKAIKALFRFSITSVLCWPGKSTSNAAPVLPVKNPRGEDYDPPLPIQPLPISQDKIIYVPEPEAERISVERVRWIKHYSSRQRILVVGDGDFSFSASLAVAFGRACNMIATSLDSEEFLKKNYKNAHSNIMELRRRDCHVIHDFDATVMANHTVLGHFKFDRIIYNFPHAGFFKNMPRENQLQRHRRLVSLFLKNAKEMIREDGEIHISHKTNGFHAEWNLESIASSHRLRLIEAVRFHHLEYPGYKTKYGFGGDNNFNCNPSKTYKFGIEKATN